MDDMEGVGQERQLSGEELFCAKKSLNWTNPTPYQNESGKFWLTVEFPGGYSEDVLVNKTCRLGSSAQDANWSKT